jgi:hypothetical protein
VESPYPIGPFVYPYNGSDGHHIDHSVYSRYGELMKKIVATKGLPKRLPRLKLNTLSEEFNSLLDRMQTPGARRGMSVAFNAPPEQLGKAAVARATRLSEQDEESVTPTGATGEGACMIDERFSAASFAACGVDSEASRHLANELARVITEEMQDSIEQTLSRIVVALNSMGHDLRLEYPPALGDVSYRDDWQDESGYHCKLRVAADLVISTGYGHISSDDEALYPKPSLDS